MFGRLARRSEGGQAILLLAVGASLLVALGGLAIDASNFYLVRRQGQNAADFAAFAAGKQLAASTFMLTTPPRTGDASVRAAHDFVALNGFPTVFGSTCDVATSTTYSATWFDAAGFSCGATSGFLTKVVVNVPAVAVNGIAVPAACTGANRFSCFQVTATRRVDTYFARMFGFPSYYFTVSAVVQTTPQIQGYTLPPPVAAYLYQPQAGCNPAAQQCFNEALPASRANLSCASSNCPTFWAQSGTRPSFYGTDGNLTIPISGDIVAIESNGDMVIQDTTTFCDPYNGGRCSPGTATGNKGFALSAGSKLYCSGFTGGGTANALTPCTTTGQTPLGLVAGKETMFAPLASWAPVIDTSGLADCGALVLNGDKVQNSFTVAGAPSCWSTAEPYTIQPGRYQYIVVNHGSYDFETGLYDLTGVAPVNGVSGAGYRANGIDHVNETAARDFDLCTGATPTSCPNVTASVWIGHGGGWYAPFVSSTSGSCIAGGGTAGGGGDATIIAGTGVVFRFEPTAGGFVSTHEVQGIILNAPGVGAMPAVNGAPILFDLENSSFIHLDSRGSGGDEDDRPGSQFSGLIYQTPQATAGGVEISPGLAGGSLPAVTGQVFAYTLTTFGTSGPAVDFTADYGGVSQPMLQNSGNAEFEIVSSTSLTQAVDATGNPIAGWETLTINYTDEWALDAYTMYVKVNNSQPVFFSQGIWSPAPAPGAPLPPANNNPGENFPAYPAAVAPAGYTQKADPITGQMTDWTYTIGSGPLAPKFEVSGNWTWGHQQDIVGARSANYRAVIKYTFPTPPGTAVNITTFLTDGDHCGDYYLVSAHFNNVGQANQGAQSAGSVVLIR